MKSGGGDREGGLWEGEGGVPPPDTRLSPVIGALIGCQEGRNIEVMNSFELLSHAVEENVVIDKEYYYTKEEQCKLGRWVGRRRRRPD